LSAGAATTSQRWLPERSTRTFDLRQHDRILGLRRRRPLGSVGGKRRAALARHIGNRIAVVTGQLREIRRDLQRRPLARRFVLDLLLVRERTATANRNGKQGQGKTGKRTIHVYSVRQ